MLTRPSSGPLESEAFVTELRRLERRIKKLRRLLDRVDTEFDGVLLHYQQLIASALVGPALPRSPPAALAGPRFEADRLKRLAAVGVSRLTIRPLQSGRAEISIDNHRPFALPPRLAALLRSIAGGEPGESGFVQWKSLAEITSLLATEGDAAGDAERVLSRHAVTELVRRLRRALERNEINPHLVQTDKKRGVRFALRASAVTHCDSQTTVCD